LLEWADDLKRDEETETKSINIINNNQENQNTNVVICNNSLNKSYFDDIEYDFLNEENIPLDEKEQKKSLKEDLLKLSRRFNLDLSPNMFYSRGKFIELLISSDISKYCEFRMVSQIMTRNEQGLIEKVMLLTVF
jgi:RAB protein geranylgeranyltransferase component A